MNIHSLRDGINMKDTILKKKVSPSAGVGVGQWSDPLHSQIFEPPLFFIMHIMSNWYFN